jgi:hypothetical protein
MPERIAFLICLALLSGACAETGRDDVGAEPDIPASGHVEEESIEAAPEESGLPAAVNAGEYTDAADLVRQHYTAISRGSYRRAFDLWEKGSRDFEEFSREAKQISRAVVTFGSSGRAGTVKGMPTIEVPVTVQVTSADGRTEEHHETFLLRKSPDEGWRLLQRTDA